MRQGRGPVAVSAVSSSSSTGPNVGASLSSVGSIAFPLLSPNELQKTFSQQHIVVQPSLFTEPSPQKAFDFFQTVLELVFGVPITIKSEFDLKKFIGVNFLNHPIDASQTLTEEIRQMDISKLLPCPRLYVSAVERQALLCFLKLFMELFGVKQNVSITEVLYPSAARVTLVASAAADYIQFQTVHLESDMAQWQPVIRQMEEVHAMKSQTSDLESEAGELETVLAEKESEDLELQIKLTDLQSTLLQQGQTYETLRKDIESLNETLSRETDLLAQLENDINLTRKRIVETRGELVESPETLKKQCEELDGHIRARKAEIEERTKRLATLKVKRELYAALCDRCKSAAEVLAVLADKAAENAKSQGERDALRQQQIELNRQLDVAQMRSRDVTKDLECRDTEHKKLQEEKEQLSRDLDHMADQRRKEEAAFTSTKAEIVKKIQQHETARKVKRGLAGALQVDTDRAVKEIQAKAKAEQILAQEHAKDCEKLLITLRTELTRSANDACHPLHKVSQALYAYKSWRARKAASGSRPPLLEAASVLKAATRKVVNGKRT